VDRLDRQLRLFKATLEVWLDVQRAWIALEPVFAAPDIQRQLPAESHAFVQVGAIGCGCAWPCLGAQALDTLVELQLLSKQSQRRPTNHKHHTESSIG